MRILRLKDVTGKTGLAQSTIYKYLKLQKFPKPVPLGGRSIGWVESEVEDWILARVQERDMSEQNHV